MPTCAASLTNRTCPVLAYAVACLRGCISTPQSNPLMRKHMVRALLAGAGRHHHPCLCCCQYRPFRCCLQLAEPPAAGRNCSLPAQVPVGRCQQATTQYDYSTFNPVFSSTAPGGAAVAKGKAVGK